MDQSSPVQAPPAPAAPAPLGARLHSMSPEAREAIANVVRDAQQAAAQARLEAQARIQARAQGQPPPTRVQVEGSRIIVGGAQGSGGGAVAAGPVGPAGTDFEFTSQGPGDHNPFDMIPPQAFDVAMAFFLMIAVIAVGVPFARAFGRRVDSRPLPMAAPPELSAQLQRIEHAVEAMAIEVERISEAQRYMARLETERGSDQTLLARPVHRD